MVKWTTNTFCTTNIIQKFNTDCRDCVFDIDPNFSYSQYECISNALFNLPSY